MYGENDYDYELIMSWFKNSPFLKTKTTLAAVVSKLGFLREKNEIIWPQLLFYILTLEVLTHDNLQTHVSLGKLLLTQGEKKINRWVEQKSHALV